MKDEENIFTSENFLITLFNCKNVQIFTINYINQLVWGWFAGSV